MRFVTIAIAATIAVSTLACGSSPVDEEGDADPDTEAAATESQAASADDCKPRPWQPLGVCHVWRRDELRSIGCPRNKGRGWREWSQSGCSYAPGGVCERGEPRRQLREEASLPWCSR